MAGCSRGTVTVHPPTVSLAVQERCAHLGNALPHGIEHLTPRVITPLTPLVHAWGNPAVVLTCGVPTPAGYSAKSSETTEVDGVRWFEEPGTSVVVWTALRPTGNGDQTVNVRLQVPTHYEGQGAFLVDLAQPLRDALPAG